MIVFLASFFDLVTIKRSKSIDMWRRAGRGGTHVAIRVAVGVVVMGSFGLIARSTIAITAPIERLCDNNKQGVSFFAYLSIV